MTYFEILTKQNIRCGTLREEQTHILWPSSKSENLNRVLIINPQTVLT